VSQAETTSQDDDVAKLRAKIRKLADEKSYLQLILNLIEKIDPLPGIEDMVSTLLHSIVNVIGGTNIKLYYWIEQQLHYADFAGARRLLDAIDDPMAAESAHGRRFMELAQGSAEGLMQGDVSPGTWTWAFPLAVGDDLVGVIKLENLHFPAAPLRHYLPIFFNHAALILSNEVRNEIRRRIEDNLRLAASVFATSRDGIVITDVDNNIVDVNPAFSRITGYRRDEVLGRNPRLLKSGRQDAAFYAEMWRALGEHRVWRGELWNRNKAGEVYAELMSIAAVTDADGKLLRYVGVFSDISNIKEHEAELDRIAHYDPLTGVPNRRLLADRMNQAIARAHRDRKPLAICYLDLDGFKPINDRYGHEIGDRLLVAITRALQDVLRAGDTIARLGGDEFVLLFNDLAAGSDSFSMLDRVLAAVAEPLLIDRVAVTVSASVGVTIYPDDNADADTLLRHADQAMYRAKEAGKNRYHLFDIEQDRQAKARVESRKHLIEALAQDQFVMYYQPQVDLIAGKVLAAEALIRWQHPQRGLLPPAAFLPAIDDISLEVALGEWVLEAVLRQAAAWKAAGLALRVSANVGAKHLQQPEFIDRLLAILARYPTVRADELELEILESAAIEDMDGAFNTLREGVVHGLRFALDDFGTGYSSLSYLRRLPVDTLKIDRSFVSDMLVNPGDADIVESVVPLAGVFGRSVVAEGVETRAQGLRLIELGCRNVQGYGIARPMPAAELPGWMARWQRDRNWSEP